MKQKLNTALLIDSFNISAWAYLILEKIIASDYATISLILMNKTAKHKKGIIWIVNNLNYILFFLSMKLDSLLFKQNPDAFDLKNSEALLKGIPLIKSDVANKNMGDIIPEKDIKRIKQSNIDVILKLGFETLNGKILQAAKYGVWELRSGDTKTNRGDPGGFWEFFNDANEIGTTLQILDENDENNRIIYRSFSGIDKVSLHRSKNNCYWKSLEFIPRKLKELYEVGPEEFFKRTEKLNPFPNFYSKRLYSYTQATNIVMLLLLIKHFIRYLKIKFIFTFFNEQWFILYDLNTAISKTFYKFKKMIPPPDRCWADPSIVYDKDMYYIYIEEFMFKPKKGHISLITMDKNGNYTKPKKIIEKTYHLSYPLVFKYDNDYYMIPESIQNNTIDLYKCVYFPDKWEFVKNLFTNVRAVDNTIFFHNGIWWLFSNMVINKGATSYDELFLHYSNDLFSDNWTAHPMNPIVSDVKKARPAGKLFTYNGKIYRPSQNCSHGYGVALILNEVIIINENEYYEIETDCAFPFWDNSMIALHTFNYEAGLTVIDGIANRIKPLFY